MALAAGTRLGSYEILSLLGAGGMGEVYRARDTKLSREVALKVLPEAFAKDAERMARFRREAQVLAALNHPNIAAIYGLEESGPRQALVMELVEGPTLAERIAGVSVGAGLARPTAQGAPKCAPATAPIPLDESLDIAKQIAHALEAAHEKGIIHRDLKPANVKVRPDGTVKVLDFGLAKALNPQDSGSNLGQTDSRTLSVAPSQPGMILGTVGYMSPEQARGKPVDKRGDIWAFGAVLYEMLTGTQLFGGETLPDRLAAVVTKEPDWDALPASTPPRIRQLLSRCLDKDPRRRLQAIGDGRIEIEDAIAVPRGYAASTAPPRAAQGVPLREPTGSAGETRKPTSRAWWPLKLVAMLAMLTVGAAIAWYVWQRWQPRPEPTQHQLTTNSSELAVTASAISLDGRYLAYADDSGIHLRVIDTAETHDLPTPADSRINKLAWFPEGNKLLASGETGLPRAPSLWTVSILGGLPQKLRHDATDGSVFQDGTGIAFVTGDGKEIWQMSPAGEEARKVITAPEGEFFATPVVVEGRLWYAKHHASVAPWARLEYELESRDLRGGPSTILRPKLRATSGTLLPNGRFIFSRIDRPHDPSQGGSLWEISADLRIGQARGEPRRIADSPNLAISDLSATADGKRLAYVKEGFLVSVYTGDLESNGLRLVNPRRLTLSESYDHAYDWTPDSKSVLFDSNRNGTWEVFKQTLNQRAAERLVGGARPAMGPDGVSVLYITDLKYSGYPQPARIMRVALAGGPPQLLGDVQNSSVIRCARRAELCVVNESDLKGMVLYALDPVKGKGRELWRIGPSLLPEHDWDYDVTTPEWDWDVSPDGSSIALATRSAQKGIIQIRSLASGAVRELSLGGWAHPIDVRWSADGKGWFLIALSTKSLTSNGTKWPSLLRVDLEGNVQVLKQECSWSDPISSPDGRHLALAGRVETRNVWMFENF